MCNKIKILLSISLNLLYLDKIIKILLSCNFRDVVDEYRRVKEYQYSKYTENYIQRTLNYSRQRK